MTKLEKAIRFLCVFDTDCTEVKAFRYEDIVEMVVENNEAMINKYCDSYDRLIRELD